MIIKSVEQEKDNNQDVRGGENYTENEGEEAGMKECTEVQF